MSLAQLPSKLGSKQDQKVQEARAEEGRLFLVVFFATASSNRLSAIQSHKSLLSSWYNLYILITVQLLLHQAALKDNDTTRYSAQTRLHQCWNYIVNSNINSSLTTFSRLFHIMILPHTVGINKRMTWHRLPTLVLSNFIPRIPTYHYHQCRHQFIIHCKTHYSKLQ